MTVVDASVAIKWFIEEPGTEAAEAVLSGPENIESAIELALQIRHPLHDCIYLALARHRDGMLVTADPKFAKRARSSYAKVKCLA